MNNLKKKLKKQHGFTLIEMLIVVAIIAILIAVSIPLVSTALEKARDATDQANERAAKAEAALYLLEVADLPAGVTEDATTGNITMFYNAQDGSMVASAAAAKGSASTGYGQCRGTDKCYKSQAHATATASNDGLVIQVIINRGAGTVALSWVPSVDP